MEGTDSDVDGDPDSDDGGETQDQLTPNSVTYRWKQYQPDSEALSPLHLDDKAFCDDSPRFNAHEPEIGQSSTPFEILKSFLHTTIVDEVVRQTNM